MIHELYVKHPTEVQLMYVQRFVSKLFRYEDKYEHVIKNLKVEDMCRECRTIMYCMLTMRNLDNIVMKYPNLHALKAVEPLEKKLVLQKNSALRVGYVYPIYEKYNIII